MSERAWRIGGVILTGKTEIFDLFLFFFFIDIQSMPPSERQPILDLSSAFFLHLLTYVDYS
jgi:hypothetical protein